MYLEAKAYAQIIEQRQLYVFWKELFLFKSWRSPLAGAEIQELFLL